MLVFHKHLHYYMVWSLVFFTGFLVSLVQTAVSPVPDTAGTSFQFTMPNCQNDESYSMYVVLQTTEAVNLTLTSLDSGKDKTRVSGGSVLRLPVVCQEEPQNNTSVSAFRLLASKEVTLYIEYPDTSYLIYPDDVLSTRYTVVTCLSRVFDSSFISITGNFTMLALYLPATLETSVTVNDTVYSPGASVNFYLEESETLYISCICDLTGIKISSTLPVSVIVGAQNSSNPKLIVLQQLLPDSTWGRTFIFNKHEWVSENIMLKIVGKDRPTSVSIVLKERTIHTDLPDNRIYSIEVTVNEFIAVKADRSVSVSVLLEMYDDSNISHFTYLTLPPVLLFPFYSRFLSLDSQEMSVDFVSTLESFSHVSFNKSSDLEPFNRPMTYYLNYFLCRNVKVEYPFSLQIRDSNRAPLFAVVYLSTSTTSRIYPLGMRITAIYDACVPKQTTSGGNGDGIDNDCDNKIDEEILNGKDDDNDGLIDEDTVYRVVEQQHKHIDMAWEYHQRKKAENQQTGIASSVVSILISIGVGLSGVGCFIGFMFLIDKLKQKLENNTRVGPSV